MKGIYLHPLRLAALDRMKVLRVPELWTWGYPMEVRR